MGAGTDPKNSLPQGEAMSIFNVLVGKGYACSVKHVQGRFYIEVPVTLRGDPAYGRQSEIMELAIRGGFDAIQTGQVLRIVGK